MYRVHSISERDPAEIAYVAVAICAIDETQRHVVILHRDSGSLFRLELAWHCHLRNEPFGSTHYLWIDPRIPSRRARQVAAKCRQIWRANAHGRIPYGFSLPADAFDARTHAYLVGPSRHGLTCASFVLGVFAHSGIHLAAYDSWPTDRPGDREWQKSIIDALENQRADPTHIDALKGDVGSFRFRPEEVAAAATQAPPCRFERAKPIAAEILAVLPQRSTS